MNARYKNAGLFIWLVGCLVWVLPLRGADVREFTKTIKKEFSITQNGGVELTTKYGKVDVKTWTQSKVKIDVRIVVNAGTESEAQAVFDRINVNFSNTASLVKAVTEIAPEKSSWWQWNKDQKSDFTINYEVYLPATTKLALDARYGDVYVASLKAPANLAIKYGNFKLDGIDENATIDLSHGNGTINRVQDLRLMAAYANCTVMESKDLNLESKYSNIRVERAGDIQSESRYDTYRLGQIGEFHNNGKYDNIEVEYAEEIAITTELTNVHVGKLGRSMELNMTYGGAVIDNLAKGFQEVSLAGKHTNFKIRLEPGATFSVDFAGDFASMKYPRDLKIDYEMQKPNYHQIKGSVGSGNGRIVARLNYGGLSLGQN